MVGLLAGDGGGMKTLNRTMVFSSLALFFTEVALL